MNTKYKSDFPWISGFLAQRRWWRRKRRRKKRRRREQGEKIWESWARIWEEWAGAEQGPAHLRGTYAASSPVSPSLLFHVCILHNWPLEEFDCVYMSHWLVPSFRAWPCTVLFPHVLISLPKMSISLDTSWTFAHSSNPTQMPLVLWKFPCGSR